MSIKEFHLFHGAVLAKLIRSGKPISLSLIETKPEDSWAAYTINDEVDIFMKHSTSPHELKRNDGGYSWVFVFNSDQLAQLKEIQKKRPVYIALICGHKSVKAGRMEICYLNPEEVCEVLDFESTEQQSITVRYNTGAKKFRVIQGREEKLMISLNELDAWDIPGR